MDETNHILSYVLNVVIFIVGVVSSFVFYIFVIPWFISAPDLDLVYAVIFTGVNIVAIILSWIYFKRTHCIGDEANPLAAGKYRWFGIDITHFVYFCVRVVINAYFIYLLYHLPALVVLFGVSIPMGRMAVLGASSFFTIELIFNTYALIRSKPDECQRQRPKICEYIHIPSVCDAPKK